MTRQEQSGGSGGVGHPSAKLLVLGLLAAVVAVSFLQFGNVLSFENLARHESSLGDFQQEHPLLVYGLAFLVYVSATGLSLPGAAGLTLVFAWYFGFWRAFVLVSFASTAGATLAFLLSRYLLRDYIQTKFGERLKVFNENLRKEGAFYLFTLRLIPVVPFFAINVVMGLTPLRTSTYWWVNQVGMLPGTAVYVYAGSSIPDLATLSKKGASGILTLNLLIAFIILGLFPIVAKRVMSAIKARRKPLTES
jgi:uncharacterized membrane protein YdjX (TVP38/TMEM64 family)